MIKNLKKIIVANLLLGVTLSALTLEEFNRAIANAPSPEEKQAILCEREAVLINKDPQVCIKAATIPKERAYYYSSNGTYEEYQTAMYAFAGIIYSNNAQYSEALKMYKKALETSPNDANVNVGIGFVYATGEGVINKYNAFEHWSIAAKQGSIKAQNNLDILCRESPWACK